MLDTLKKLFSADSAPHDDDNRLQQVSAALLLEVARSDYATDPEELAKVKALLSRHYGVAAEDMDRLLEDAKAEFDSTNALHPFTRYINDNCSEAEKYALIEHAWHVALADGELSRYEEHLIRHVSELIYLPHPLFIRAKLAAQAE